MTFVAEEEEYAVPGKGGVIRGEQRIESFWRGAAGKSDGESPLGTDGGASDADEFLGGGVVEIGGGGEDFNGSSRRHGNFSNLAIS